MKEWRLVLMLLSVGLLATAGQSWEPPRGMVRVPLAVPQRASKELVVVRTKRGLCKTFNVSGNKCEVYYEEKE